MSSPTEKLLSALGVVVAGLSIGFGVDVLAAYVARDLWAWFIVPLGVPSVGVAHAYGVILLARLLAPARPDDRKAGPGEMFVRVLSLSFARVVAVLLFWGVGALMAGWMQ